MNNSFDPECITYSQMNLIFNVRIAWRRLVTWTRAYQISRYAGIGTEEELFCRLYHEVQNFSDMIQIIFGREISRRNAGYLLQYTIILRDSISAHIAGDTEAIQRNLERFYNAIQENAAFLADINPYWNEEQWRIMLETYLQYTIEEGNAFASGIYQEDIALLDLHTNLTNIMGDVFAKGIYDYITSGQNYIGADSPQVIRECFTLEQVNGIYEIRMFWFELITWVRNYMLSRYAGIGNADEVKDRLREVPAAYVRNLRLFFGNHPAIDALDIELNEFIDLLDEFITAQLAGNTEDIGRITQLLYQNASERAASVSQLSPYWDEKEWEARLFNNLRGTLDESTTFLTGEYARNLDIFSTLMDLAESSSDYFAQGVINYIRDQQQKQPSSSLSHQQQ
ncbi:hypothetical protein FRZ06_09220 [Anoxybacterium hadale]|uniref:Uncharacterized protein n=1 Tax=Anoxybacterium hadale TaxID=3408580 RepID=A0ACD1AAX5_9FIRM|nr:hypothetical protein FRZ06_09220 [Clostridiales bacterium]